MQVPQKLLHHVNVFERAIHLCQLKIRSDKRLEIANYYTNLAYVTFFLASWYFQGTSALLKWVLREDFNFLRLFCDLENSATAFGRGPKVL